jgi:hypothetical protein
MLNPPHQGQGKDYKVQKNVIRTFYDGSEAFLMDLGLGIISTTNQVGLGPDGLNSGP